MYGGFPGGASSKELAGDIKEEGSIPGLGRSLEEAWQPTPIFLPGECHEQRSLAGYS